MLPTYYNSHFYKKKVLKGNKKEKTIISEVFSDFLSNSTIHGVSYLGAKDKNLIEKTWWFIGLVLSLVACTYFINKTWTKWEQNPVIVSFAKEHTSIWEIPFPAVTICPLNKVKQTEFNYTAFHSTLYNMSLYEGWNITENQKIFWDIAFICNTIWYADDVSNVTDEDIITNIKMVSPSLIDTMALPSWQNNANKYEDIFVEHITSEGLCFTFNALGHDDMYTEQIKEGVKFIDSNETSTWSIENGYSTTDADNSYPLRTSQAGLAYGLSLELYNEVDDRSKYCGEDISGFKIVLHNPAEIPRLSETYSLVPVNQKVIIAVTPRAIRTEKNLIGVPPHTRNCYFSNEKKLRFFKIYTQYNCKIECLTNITKEYCGCLPFYLPRDNNTEICGFGKLDCLLDAKNIEFTYQNMVNKKNVVIEESDPGLFEIFNQCDCLPPCDYIDYDFDLSQAEYIYDKLYLSDDQYFIKHPWEKTPISIFFKDSQFLALERNELYGQTDFVSNIGGLLGLFMGFSFLSLLEIIYFATLRVCCKIYRKNQTRTRIVWLD